MKKLMIMAVVVMAAGLSAVASTGAAFAYQGVLRNENGSPLVGTKTVTIDFRLYESSDGDSAVWGRQMTLSIDTNGLFNAELADANGSVTVKSASTLADVIADAETHGASLYVGLTVKNSTGEIRPRQKLIPAPMAAYAQDVSVAKKDFTVEGDLIVKGNIGSQDGVLTAKSLSIEGSDTSSFSTPVDFTRNVTIGGASASSTNLIINGAVEAKGDINLGKGSKILLNGKYEGTIPVGMISLWSGSPSALPAGWVICAPKWNGEKEVTIRYVNPCDNREYDVPDLRGRFIVGANWDSENGQYRQAKDEKGNNRFDEYKPNASSGGEEKHKLTEDEMPRHQHPLSDGKTWWKVTVDDENDFGFTTPYVYKGKGDLNDTTAYSGYDAGGSSGFTGSGVAHENRPPFYAMCYIIFIGDNEVK